MEQSSSDTWFKEILTVEEVKEAYTKAYPNEVKDLRNDDYELITERLRRLARFLWEEAELQLEAQQQGEASADSAESSSQGQTQAPA